MVESIKNMEAEAAHTRRGDGLNLTRGEMLAGISTYAESDQADLTWLYGYTCDELGGSRSRLIERFKEVSWSTILKVWKGKYEADIAKYMKDVRKFRKRCEQMRRNLFIQTIVTERIMAACDVAKDRNVIVMISGPTGRSKTASLLEWKHKASSNGRVIYVYAPKAGGFRGFLEALSEALNISVHRNNYAMVHSIMHALDVRDTLIVDEVAHLYPTGKNSSIQALEFLREMFDITGCGMILSCTDGLPQLISSGKWSQWFDQLLGRAELHLRIPREFSRREIAELLSAYVEDPDASLINGARALANRSPRGCRDLFRHLDRASLVAGETKQPLTAELLDKTVAAAEAMMQIPKE